MFKIQTYEVHPELYYDPEGHFWLRVEGTRARLGMEPLVQESMGAFVVVQLEAPGKPLQKGDTFGTVEAEKYVGPLRTPVSGTLAVVNERLAENPRLPNLDPYGDGWMVEIEMSRFEEEKHDLLTGEAALRTWYEQEVKKYEEEGWLAE